MLLKTKGERLAGASCSEHKTVKFPVVRENLETRRGKMLQGSWEKKKKKG